MEVAAPAQEEVWLSCALEPEASAFAVSIVLRLRGSLNVHLLEQALSALVARHEVLRTTYHPGLEGLEQRVEAPRRVRVALCDSQSASEATVIREEARAPFDLRRNLALRARVVGKGFGQHALILTLHHIAVDGWSMAVLAREFHTIHTAYVRGERPELEGLTLRYAEFARLQTARRAAASTEERLEKVRERFRVPRLVLDMETEHRDEPYWRADQVRLVFARTVGKEVEAFGRRARATVFVVLTAVLWIVLYSRSQCTPFVMACDYANRCDPDASGTIGLFVSQILFRVAIEARMTFAAVMRQVQEELQQALEHAECPVGLLVPNEGTSIAQPFRVKLAFQPGIESPGLQGIEVVGAEVVSYGAKCDLLFSVSAERGQTLWELQYRKALFERDDMAEVLEQIQATTSLALRNPQSTVAALSSCRRAELAS